MELSGFENGSVDGWDKEKFDPLIDANSNQISDAGEFYFSNKINWVHLLVDNNMEDSQFITFSEMVSIADALENIGSFPDNFDQFDSENRLTIILFDDTQFRYDGQMIAAYVSDRENDVINLYRGIHNYRSSEELQPLFRHEIAHAAGEDDTNGFYLFNENIGDNTIVSYYGKPTIELGNETCLLSRGIQEMNADMIAATLEDGLLREAYASESIDFLEDVNNLLGDHEISVEEWGSILRYAVDTDDGKDDYSPFLRLFNSLKGYVKEENFFVPDREKQLFDFLLDKLFSSQWEFEASCSNFPK